MKFKIEITNKKPTKIKKNKKKLVGKTWLRLFFKVSINTEVFESVVKKTNKI